MTWILTRTGKRFDLFEPKPEMIDPRDLSHALAHLCRFNGHAARHYSVAQHSYLVSGLVPAQDKLAGLLHDATEAYVGDMVRPLKEQMPAFREVEDRIWQAICARFDLDEELPASVKHADLQALATERRDLMPRHPAEWTCLQGVEPLEACIKPWSIEEAHTFYHYRLMELLSSTHRAANA
ncbi:phosphohydrolase [Pseudomonas citronellolis]|uniref:phosphohydrolase n=1 Tax=Pseudomonas citronellolis TaxID=53408 RepID=UPI0022711E9A|nr:phosphohydrolase [Pseudomonas citronellolis]WAB92513.1 phosphohydrolase [Pseudomonas citronellolis]